MNEPSMFPLGIAVVDDQPLFRHGVILSILSQCRRIISGPHDGQGLTTFFESARPDILIVAASSSDELLALISLSPEDPPRTIVFTDSATTWSQIYQWRSSGVLGFIDRFASPPELREAVKRVAARKPFLSASLERAEPAKFWARISELDTTDVLVLEYLARGEPKEIISRDLGLSVARVAYKLRRLYRFLLAKNRAQAIGRLLTPAIPESQSAWLQQSPSLYLGGWQEGTVNPHHGGAIVAGSVKLIFSSRKYRQRQ